MTTKQLADALGVTTAQVGRLRKKYLSGGTHYTFADNTKLNYTDAALTALRSRPGRGRQKKIKKTLDVDNDIH